MYKIHHTVGWEYNLCIMIQQLINVIFSCCDVRAWMTSVIILHYCGYLSISTVPYLSSCIYQYCICLCIYWYSSTVQYLSFCTVSIGIVRLFVSIDTVLFFMHLSVLYCIWYTVQYKYCTRTGIWKLLVMPVVNIIYFIRCTVFVFIPFFLRRIQAFGLFLVSVNHKQCTI